MQTKKVRKQRARNRTISPVPLPPEGEAIVRRPVVMGAFGISNTTLRRMMLEGKIPKPVKLGSISVGWKLSELRAALAKL